MLSIALVNYGMRNKQASPRSKCNAITRFCDLNLRVNTNTTI